MSVALTKIEEFSENLGKGAFNLATDQIKIALTNTAPTVGTASVYADLTAPIAGTNLDGVTPFNVTTTSYVQTSGIAKLILADLTLTANGSVGPFQYVVLYSDTATNKELIGYYDYGSAVTLAAADTFKVDFDGSAGALTVA
ncbi:MAG: hypothetical protein PF488_02940 [Patescibacteria group bacterium]|jgi:hypothetical protein|nr:hypothetical protein [Patescibacteria group bacterium]